MWWIANGDSREVLRAMADASVDSVVCDPPYELGFMGKRWDASGIAYDVGLWAEVLRVLKPGGHLLAFGGTRTYHRMACAIEDAGFEVRDSIHWIYGSGFPKSLDVSKAIDKQRYDRADIYRVTAWVRAARDAARIGNRDIDEAFGFAGMAGHWTSAKSQPAVPTLEQVPLLLGVLGLTLDDVPDDIRLLLLNLNGLKGQPGENWWKREVTGQHKSAAPGQTWSANYGINANLIPKEQRDIPATEAARQWAGWGTALKPAHEPVVVARKPLDGTVAANVLAHGTGAINVDGCRVGQVTWKHPGSPAVATSAYGDFVGGGARAHDGGRWPPNILLSHTPDCGDECADGCAVAEMDGQSGTLKSGNRKAGEYETQGYMGAKANPMPAIVGDTGGASRFFPVFRYQAKASRADRDAGLQAFPISSGASIAGRAEGSAGSKHARAGTVGPRANVHPTVKPTELMRWLVRIVTPPNGLVLDPFTGSGSTGVAAVLEGFRFAGVELSPEYVEIARARVAHAEASRPNTLPGLGVV